MKTAIMVVSLFLISTVFSAAAAFGTISAVCMWWGDLMFIMWDYLDVAMSIGTCVYALIFHACLWWVTGHTKATILKQVTGILEKAKAQCTPTKSSA